MIINVIIILYVQLSFLACRFVLVGYNNNNNNDHHNVCDAIIMIKVIVRVHPVHSMNVD